MKAKILDRLRGKLIVSCQAYEENPFYGAENMVKMAQSAKLGGAEVLRICWPEQVKAVKAKMDIMIVGINKQFHEGMNILDDVFITPTYKSAVSLIEAGCEIVAMDGTLRKRTYEDLAEIVKNIKQAYPQVVLMADISTLQEGIQCEAMGFDILSTTLSGYTRATKTNSEQPDYDLIKQLKKHTKCLINAEGRIWSVEQLQKVMAMEPDCVTIGSAITNPMKISEHFMKTWKGL
ncbi:N-acylglucosamine-6-phosphate 2-epimerase [Breznakia sp. PF5-3]|uniref:N-acetylmannosamine-6-phosphate 2-epimerase n=1 Tax=unclassified Breznakia TaxID=2623764 RepID=UPI002406A6A7|nr:MULTISPECIES: N-acetylmannosamine-6-phosphate 2-epimerase [unclassified Breznakia]MDF9825875.1 N-acylglucosamine-6-phosphate 2-epimerase [Breznakia sp. PM6-1]MDF9836671.1 N-acylglucosamine-6-phosphate 2-epimerase [Breznakia sp. PF5-3]MDF9838945.1 N-acylglucosamine-6-phosphate 2-epimerase [Breznakia sp. PFB2-8]MDF9860971.1 N-acylglucosamine-6-phosphate 2-epimerase [Breznakia sp. PH5-24]